MMIQFERPTKEAIEEVAKHLRWLSNQIRLAGDIPYVRFEADRISNHYITLADDLWLQSVVIDPEHMFDDMYDPDKPPLHFHKPDQDIANGT